MAKYGFLDAPLQTGSYVDIMQYIDRLANLKSNLLPALTLGLPKGVYCNIIDDCATSISVGGNGVATISINNYEEPYLAVCVGTC